MKRKIQISLRISIAVAAYVFIAVKIGFSGIARIFDLVIGSFNSANLLWFSLIIALMPAVWALEAVKWRKSISIFTKVSFLRSWRSVWYGVVAGQLTPNRIGEPVGRLALIDEEVRGKASVAAIWCSFTQQIATVLFGLLSIIWWIEVKQLNVLPSGIPLWIIVSIILAWVGFMLYLIFDGKRIAHWFEGFGWIKNLLHGEKLDFSFSASVILFVQTISILRYLIFSTQYVLLLKLFGVNGSTIDLYAVVGLTYLFSSFIPSFSVSEVGIKAGFAIWFAGMISNNAVGVTAASLIIWILNLAVPALIAAWFPWRESEK